MKVKLSRALFVLYLAIWGSYCGLEINTFVEDLPFFQMDTILIFINVVFVLLLPPLMYCLCVQAPQQWKKYFMPAVLILNSIYFHLAILLSIYKADRHMDFDFNYFLQNISVAWSVLWKLFALWLVVIFLSLILFALLQPVIFDPAVKLLKKSSWKLGLTLGVAITISFFCQCLTLESIRGSATGFLYAGLFSDQQLRGEYRNLYENHLRELQANGVRGAERGDASRFGDMVIMVQQESLNGLLVGPKVTPQLLRAAENGILFSELYGNSIQSQRGYECILCGVPPNIGGQLVEEFPFEDVEKIGCLPRQFKALGYQPIAFYGGDPNPRTTRLLEAIGFERIFADDIMQPDDVMYEWGYREDIWFTRINDYITTHFKTGKYFIFITASATNHTPFKVLDPRFHDKIPYTDPKNFEENLSNTTYVQDSYFGLLFDLYRESYSDRATLIAVSDHSWPIPIHKHNIYNERGAFEENFRIAMLFIPPSSSREFAVGTTAAQRFSQMDILPTFLELAGVRQDYWLGESFAPWLLADPDIARTEPQKMKISIQPYGGGFIAIHRYPQKFLFDVLGKNVKIYDLLNDPGETSPALSATDQHISLIRDFFQ
jgi:arylsulfatase A-like enzyme